MRTLRREGATGEIAKYGEENVALCLTSLTVSTQKPTWVSSPGASSLPGGEMAVKMVNPTVLQVGDTVFAHARIDSSTVDYGFQRLNDEVAAWIMGKTSTPPKQVLEEKGVVDAQVRADAGVTAEAAVAALEKHSMQLGLSA